MVRFSGCSLRYKTKQVFSSLDAGFDKGSIHTIIGPSGCGKTSLLYLAAGLLQPDSGTVSVDASIVSTTRNETAVVLQDHGLFPWKRVYDNLALGLQIRGEDKETTRVRSTAMLDRLGLSDCARRYPHQLSGGEQQRVALGRALLLEPDLMLLDEPFSSLDAMTRENLQDLLKSIHADALQNRTTPLTMMLVTHSIEEAVFLSRNIHIMDRSGNLHTLPPFESSVSDRTAKEYHDRCDSVRQLLTHYSGGSQ